MLLALCFEPSRFFLKGKERPEKTSYIHKHTVREEISWNFHMLMKVTILLEAVFTALKIVFNDFKECSTVQSSPFCTRMNKWSVFVSMCSSDDDVPLPLKPGRPSQRKRSVRFDFEDSPIKHHSVTADESLDLFSPVRDEGRHEASPGVATSPKTAVDSGGRVIREGNRSSNNSNEEKEEIHHPDGKVSWERTEECWSKCHFINFGSLAPHYSKINLNHFHLCSFYIRHST